MPDWDDFAMPNPTAECGQGGAPRRNRQAAGSAISAPCVCSVVLLTGQMFPVGQISGSGIATAKTAIHAALLDVQF